MGSSTPSLTMATRKMLSAAFGILTLASGALGAGAQVCPKDQFTCVNGVIECIPSSNQCDGTPDCGDGSDESPSACGGCPSYQFQCADGTNCIPTYWVCDGAFDCADESDESEEKCGNCKLNQFACADGKQCVHEAWKCDGAKDCIDGSDEEPSSCV